MSRPAEQMAFQFEIPAIGPVDGSVDQAGTLEERFEEFHRKNPHVYQALRRLALDMRARGRKRYGMKGLFEILRWSYAMRTEDPDSEFKLNNVYTAFYARLLMQQEPALRGFFELREQRWDKKGGH